MLSEKEKLSKSSGYYTHTRKERYSRNWNINQQDKERRHKQILDRDQGSSVQHNSTHY
jgi:hypothetical protein